MRGQREREEGTERERGRKKDRWETARKRGRGTGI